MNSFTKREISLMKKMNTPAKVQDYLNTVGFNFEVDGRDSFKSPQRVLRTGSAHCIEGAVFAAYVLSLHGYLPLILHLESTKNDFDHVICVFKRVGLWGAISKTNHAVLRYREPIYKTIRELVVSYFHEYFTNDGKKTLRRYSRPLNLNIFEKGWETEEENLFGIDEELNKIAHYDIAPREAHKNFRLADKIEREAGKIVEYTSLPKKLQE